MTLTHHQSEAVLGNGKSGDSDHVRQLAAGQRNQPAVLVVEEVAADVPWPSVSAWNFPAHELIGAQMIEESRGLERNDAASVDAAVAQHSDAFAVEEIASSARAAEDVRSDLREF